MTNLANMLSAAVERNPTGVALRLDDRELSYAVFDAATARVAGLLAQSGIGPGDRVGVMLPNVPHFPIAYYGILRLGAVVVPMNVLLKQREIAYYLGDSQASTLLAWDGFAAEAQAGAARAGVDCRLVGAGELVRLMTEQSPLDEVAAVDASDTAVILYTSGTTGAPKGAELTHVNLTRNAEVSAGLFGLDGEAITLGALPLFHSFGQTCGMNATIRAAGCLTLIPRFDPTKALEIIQRDRVTVFEGVPTMYSAMLEVPNRGDYDTSTLRVCASGGASMPVELMRGFEAAFGCTILEGYGLSETSPVASFNQPDQERKVGSIGTPIPGVEMKLVDDAGGEPPVGGVGEILIRGHNLMKGYWRQPDATAEAIDADGWFRSGDLAVVDDDGYFFIVDRKKDMIIRGGYNVYPREIEEVLYEHPAVREAAVLGMPDAQLGEEVGAAVAVRDGFEVTEAELRDYVRDRVAAYKYPRRVWFVGDLPKGPTGKILKREIEVPAAG
ncbi:MAG TPA: long-chain fatty acid--CoA ligase [Solirubrobacteraceae bacterium]|jgi:long-chain acyl-CoA synthetase|nr:long-chain fatty acid--CoA ligase [Solirubrobacteraceae bacterium]